MGKRSDLRKFRRRRRWAGFFLLVSLALMAFSVMLIRDMISPDVQPTASGSAGKAGVDKVASVRVADAPEAASRPAEDEAEILASEEEDKKTAAERAEVDREAAQKADEKVAAEDQAAQRVQKSDTKSDTKSPLTPTPPTNDLWMSIPALGLYDNFVTNSGSHAAMDYGAIKLPETAFPWVHRATTSSTIYRF
jgi:sortase A